ncbi:hypothetical protein [Paenibacillus sp. FSL M7-0420]|uniref:hypothetical protein n=1 Tax=Paenibacillus sp. FSL M7-0420 TaxID=2921609 RepID=UPI0030F6AA22
MLMNGKGLSRQQLEKQHLIKRKLYKIEKTMKLDAVFPLVCLQMLKIAKLRYVFPLVL